MAADEGDRGLATDASATAKPGLSGAADSGPPGWASADQARSWCHAANLASRLQCHDVSSAQLWLVLDGIFPHGWEHEEQLQKIVTMGFMKPFKKLLGTPFLGGKRRVSLGKKALRDSLFGLCEK